MQYKFSYQLDFGSMKDVKSIYINDKLPGTGVVRLGDIDLDGFPDFVITVLDSNGKPRTVFFDNKECDANFIATLNSTKTYTDTSRCRHYQRVDNMGLIENKDIYSLSFFDYHELG